MKFPDVSGSNLQRERVNLPVDLEGELNMLFIPFQQWQQAIVDSWIPWAREIEQGFPGLRYYELPTIEQLPLLARFFINEGMRAGIPDPVSRQRTITLYVDKSSFCQALGMNTEKTIYILLVDRQGNVIDQQQGEYSPEKARLLLEAIEQSLMGEKS